MTHGALSLPMEMPNAESYLKEASVIYGFYLLAARLPKLHVTSKLKGLDCSHLFNSEHRSKLSTNYSSGERWYGIVEVQFFAMTGAVDTLIKAMLHEAIFVATCNATMTNKKPFKLQRGRYTQATCLATTLRKVEGRSTFLATRSAAIAVARWGVLWAFLQK